MAWQELTIHTSSAEEASEVSDWLLEQEASAVSFFAADDEEIFEPEVGQTQLWLHTAVVGLFDAKIDLQPLCASLAQDYQIAPLVEQDWTRSYQDLFKPLSIGNDWWICPSWEKSNAPAEKTIHLDPGLAFGTGSHPTTQLCLNWLTEQSLDDKTVVDYGCGSGILAITACRLGAKQVVATDIDPQALEASRDNATKNHLTAEQLILAALPLNLEPKADLLIANILANPLITLVDTFINLLKPQASLVLSGILEQQEERIDNAFSTHFTKLDRRQSNGWLLLHWQAKF